jgi:hypothetical protein
MVVEADSEKARDLRRNESACQELNYTQKKRLAPALLPLPPPGAPPQHRTYTLTPPSPLPPCSHLRRRRREIAAHPPQNRRGLRAYNDHAVPIQPS